MIIQGNPELGLQPHQQDAYSSIKEAYKTRNKAAVVIPTGCGKSFIALQLMADNKDKRMLFMAPTNAIKNQMYNYIAKYIVGEKPTRQRPAKMIAEEYFPNFKIMLYPSLLRMKSDVMDKLKPDIIIMDELHRTGAEKWGEKVNALLEKNPNAKILGVTATPDRRDNTNIVDELFEGNVDYELTLVDAIKNGVVQPPDYVKCDYALGDYLDGIKSAIANCSDEETKKELQDKYDKMRKIVDNADGIPELFARHMKKENEKYIVFCKDKEHMNELMEKSKEWFKDIDSDPEIYSVYSGEGYTKKENKKNIEKFENSKSEHMKLLFSVDMLNEGLHVEDISGVIMLRPTDSRIIYLQQLGRALSSDTTREKTIVFDLVNNYLKNNLDVEINGESRERQSNDDRNQISDYKENFKQDDIDIFRIQGETKEFLDLLNEVQGILSRSDYLTNARAIKEWIEQSGGTKPPSQHSKNQEEKRLGNALSTIRNKVIKPYISMEDEEKSNFREKYPEIDEIIAIIDQIDKNKVPTNLANAKAIKEWIEKSGGTKPPSKSSKNQEEKTLGFALGTIRHYLIKPYMSLQNEEEKRNFREKYPEIDEIIAIITEIDKNNEPIYLVNARAIKEWIEKSGGTKPPAASSKKQEEKTLGQALSTIRQKVIKPYISMEDEEKRNFREKYPEIDEIITIINEIDKNNKPIYLVNARVIKEWIEKSGGTKPPSTTSKNQEEKRLGMALSTIRKQLIKPYISMEDEGEKREFKEKHPEIDEVMDIISEIDLQCGTKKQKDLAVLIRQDLEKRKALQEVKKLEKEYEKQILIKQGNQIKDTQKQGVDIDE